MKIVAHTQYRENYGAHDWNGEGECPQYWKAKGGYTYHVLTLTAQEAADLGRAGMEMVVAEAGHEWIENNDDYSREYIVDWELVEDGWKHPDEWETIHHRPPQEVAA